MRRASRLPGRGCWWPIAAASPGISAPTPPDSTGSKALRRGRIARWSVRRALRAPALARAGGKRSILPPIRLPWRTPRCGRWPPQPPLPPPICACPRRRKSSAPSPCPAGPFAARYSLTAAGRPINPPFITPRLKPPPPAIGRCCWRFTPARQIVGVRQPAAGPGWLRRVGGWPGLHL